MNTTRFRGWEEQRYTGEQIETENKLKIEATSRPKSYQSVLILVKGNSPAIYVA